MKSFVQKKIFTRNISRKNLFHCHFIFLIFSINGAKIFMLSFSNGPNISIPMIVPSLTLIDTPPDTDSMRDTIIHSASKDILTFA